MKYKYGYLEIKAKIPQHPTSTALWLSGKTSENTNAFAEIDILENFYNTDNNDKVILTNIHSWDNDTTQRRSLDDFSAERKKATKVDENLTMGYHTYAFEWNENEMKFYLDGNCYYTYSITDGVLGKKPNGFDNADTFRQLMDLKLSSTMGLGNYGPIWTVGDSEKTELLIDYVRLYQKSDDKGELYVNGVKKNTNQKLIAFTFDDGPNSELQGFTDLFKQNDAKATYFLIGQNINDNHKTVLKNAVDSGMELGNHSYTHTRMTTVSSADEIVSDFQKCNDRVKSLIGYDIKIARLPNLDANDTVYKAVKQLGMPCFHSVYTYGRTQSVQDWDSNFSTEDICDAIRRTYYDGAIYCCHVTGRTLAAMKILLPELAAEGYKFVTVSELMKSRGYNISDLPLNVQIRDAGLNSVK